MAHNQGKWRAGLSTKGRRPVPGWRPPPDLLGPEEYHEPIASPLPHTCSKDGCNVVARSGRETCWQHH